MAIKMMRVVVLAGLLAVAAIVTGEEPRGRLKTKCGASGAT